MRRYPREISDFIIANHKGITTAELVDKINAEFGSSYTDSQIRSYKKNHHLSSGIKPGARETYYSKVFPREVCEYIRANCAGVGHKKMAKRLNSMFGTEYTASQIKSHYANHQLSSGLTGRFEKGHVSYNKGRKGYYASGSEKGWFKQGHMPKNHKPVGTESFRASDGYWWVKIAEPNKWREKHVLVWEAAHGKRPAGHIITFLDGDRDNCALENLKLITLAEHAVMSHGGYRSTIPAYTETGIILARIKMANTAAKKHVKRKMRKTSTLDKEET